MSQYNLNSSPYYDDYDHDKKYTQILAVPGRVAQAREFTQAQSLVKDIIRGIGNSIMSDGDILEGCQISISSDKTSIRLSPGKVYMSGIVYNVEEQTAPITGVGSETVGIILSESIVTESLDSSLRDPAIGYDNYNKAGAHRLRGEILLTVNNPSAAVITTLVNGDLQLETFAPEYDTLTQTLARRTYDESGSYIVKGLDVKMEVDPNDPSLYVTVIEAGKAYVMGYELGIATARRIQVPRSTEYDLVTASNLVYLSVTADYLLDRDLYVRNINSVTGTVSYTEANLSISSGTGSSLLTKTTVLTVTSVYNGETTYTQGTDYELVRDGSRYYIHWLGVTYPGSGVAYTAVYTYTKTFSPNTEYSLVVKDNGHYLRWLTPGSPASHPLAGTNFTVQYNQYLARKDLVYVDSVGGTYVKRGIPSEYGFEVAPEAPVNTLALAVVMSPPNGSVASDYSSQKISVTNVGLTRFTMSDIQAILNRLRVLEYDTAVTSLENDALNSYTTNEKRGVFTDPFVDLSRSDVSYNLDIDGSILDEVQPTYRTALDLEANIAYLPVTDVCLDLSPSATNLTASIRDSRLCMLGVIDTKIALEQPHASRVYLINPYSNYPGIPIISLTPFVDSWIDETIIEIPQSLTKSTIISTSSNIIRSTVILRGKFKSYTVSSDSATTTEVGATTETYTTNSIINESAVEYIRQREITVYGENFPPTLDNIRCYFDDKLVALTPLTGTTAGTSSGSVRSDSLGAFSATFTIPEGVKTGLREVKLVSDTLIDGWLTNASTVYQASGISRTIEATVTTLTTVLLKRTITTNATTYVDPLGQSFVLGEDSLLSGVDVYFEGKPSTDIPVTLEIRGVSNGVIDNTVYASKTLRASEVFTNSTSAVATRFTLDSPAYILANTLYAFVLKSTSDDYRVWGAEIGDNDIQSGNAILKNAYLAGTMYSSSNNAAWTIHQTSDLKFRLITSTYSSTGNIYFTPLTGLDWTSFVMTADSIIPNNTDVTWMYSLDGSNYAEFSPYTPVRFSSIISSLYIKAILSKESTSSLSPILALDTVSIIGSKFDTLGDYISKNISGLDEYDIASVVVETYIPAGSSLSFYVSRDDGATWNLMTKEDSSSVIRDYGWTEHTYTMSYVEGATQCRFRIHFDSNNSFTSPAVRRLRGILTKEI